LYLESSVLIVEIETWNLCPLALEESIIDSINKGKKAQSNYCGALVRRAL
jgi:hypothetical protein